jgi:hypothetical protein
MITGTRHRALSLLAATAVALAGGAAVGAPAAGAADRTPASDGPVTILSKGTAYAPPGGEWGAVSRGDAAILGHPGHRVGYSWRVRPGSSTQVCAQARGFNAQSRSTWYAVGCGSSGSGTVPWGNNGAYPELRVRSLNILTGGIVDWHT